MRKTAGIAAVLWAAMSVVTPASSMRAIEAEAGVVPLKVIQTVEPAFPASAQWTGLSSGEVHVLIAVDRRGRLTDWLVTAETDASFTREAIDALRRWRFEPMRRDGVAVGARTEIQFKFARTGLVVVTMSSVDQDIRRMFRSSREVVKSQVYALDELDRPLEPVAAATPEYPEALRADPRTGKAVVDFYVDEQGRVRLPIIVEQDHPAFGESVLAAAAQWRFTTPRRDGKPAITRAAQEFTFSVRP